MIPSSAVEDYLKAIVLGQAHLVDDRQFVPMGEVAAAAGIANVMPGQLIEVEDRDEISDSVRLKGRRDQRMTIGMRAAAKLLVE